MWSVVLSFAMVMAAALVRVQMWTPKGLMLAFGNREELPLASSMAGRADRAANNMLVSLLWFAALLLAAHAAGKAGTRLDQAAQLFFWARLAYFPLYWAGIQFARTASWAVAIVAIGMVASTLI